MPDTQAHTTTASRSVGFRIEEDSKRSRKSKVDSVVNPIGQTSAAVEWIDIDTPLSKRRKKRSTISHSGQKKGYRRRSRTDGDIGQFFPKLARILESGDSTTFARSPHTGKTSRRERDPSTVGKTRLRKERDVPYHRPVKHRPGSIHRRTEVLSRLDPSLLSLLSNLTHTSGDSDKSSSSNTTITQQSYDREHNPEGPKRSYKTKRSDTESETGKDLSGDEFNVFDYMENTTNEDGRDGRSMYCSSSSSSHYEPSDAGSSELATTPSSQSTYGSPTSTRSGSLTGSMGVAELRRKYDPQYRSPPGSRRSTSSSPPSSGSSLKKVPEVRDVAEEFEGYHSRSSQDGRSERRRSSSRSSQASQLCEDRLKLQQDAMRHHVAQSHQKHHRVDSVHAQHRSPSASSTSSAESQRAWQQYMAMQQHQNPPPHAYPVAAQATNGHQVSHTDHTQAPEPPDLTQRTLVGYELLARELSEENPTVEPMYRRFAYLNHRLLLHMQDELQDMEERLRTYDEIIAQMESCPTPEGQTRPPPSRRMDAFNGSEVHHQRTLLLGRIFQKMEQYNRAMVSFSSAKRECVGAERDQVAIYREWMRTKAPIHEIETKFLESENDLIVPGATPPQPSPPPPPPAAADTGILAVRHVAAFTCLPLTLMLPLLLFAIIPTLTGRLTATLLISIGAVLVAATTRIRNLLPAHEWAVCGAAYVLIMAAIAGCVPQHQLASHAVGAVGRTAEYVRY